MKELAEFKRWRPLHAVGQSSGVGDSTLKRLVAEGHLSSLQLPGSAATLLDPTEVVNFLAGLVRPAKASKKTS